MGALLGLSLREEIQEGVEEEEAQKQHLGCG